MQLPWGFTLGGAGTLLDRLRGGSDAVRARRREALRPDTRSIRLKVHNRDFTVGGFGPQVSVVREDRTSNARLHDYERTSGGPRFVRLFQTWAR